MIILIDPQAIILRVNQACEIASGYQADELIGKSFVDLLVPEARRSQSRIDIQKLVESKGFIRTISTWVRKDGEQVIIDGSSSVMLNPDGEPVMVIGIGIDVTNERNAQCELVKSQERFELAVQSSQDGIWEVYVVSNTYYFSPRWKEMLGFEDSELSNERTTWIDRIHPEDLITVRRYQAAFTSRPNQRHESEFRMRHKDGSWRWILSRGVGIYENGEPVRVVGAHKDITLRKIQEQALKDSEARLQEAVDIANLGLWELDLNTSELKWAKKTFEIYGLDPNSAEPTLEGLLSTNYVFDQNQVRESIALSASSGQPYQQSRRILRQDGELRHIITTARVIKDASGVPVRAVGIVQDVTEQQLAEEAIIKAREQAIEASRLKSEFLANMSHEIRTPMNGVSGVVDLLLDTELNSQQRDYVNIIRSSADGLMTILNDILDFSKIEAGKMSLDLAEMDVLQVVEDVSSIFARPCREKQVELIIDADWAAHFNYVGDAVRIRQILINLVSNALKFTPEGSITIGLKTSDGGVHFRVEDTGLGIPVGRHQAIFDSFTQADGSTTRRYGGTGLGLAIVKQLADLMGGSVGVSSTPGNGSRFDVVLPLELALVANKELPLHGQTILLVTDNQRFHETFPKLLGALGATVRSISGVENAIASLMLRTYTNIIIAESIPFGAWSELQKVLGKSGGNLLLVAGTNLNVPAGIDGVLTLPLSRRNVENVLLTRPVSDPQELARSPMFIGHKLLLVEDNLVNQMVAMHQLERMGFQIDTAINGVEAVEAASEKTYDIILMDIQMPEMDGITATRSIRELPTTENRPVIIAMTAHAMQGDRERCIEAGMDDYLTKPVRPQELLTKLMSWLSADSQTISLINWDYLHDLSEGDEVFERQILEVYLKTTPAIMQSLGEALRSNSFQAIVRLAHTLRGSSRSIGANQFGDLCQEVESLAEQNQAYRHLDRLERQFNELIDECQKFVKR